MIICSCNDKWCMHNGFLKLSKVIFVAVIFLWILNISYSWKRNILHGIIYMGGMVTGPVGNGRGSNGIVYLLLMALEYWTVLLGTTIIFFFKF